jgi:hypothetical protein
MKRIYKRKVKRRKCASNQGIKKEVITSISGVQIFSTFRIRGVLQGQRVTMLIDGGASHNFIDAALVRKRHIPTIEFDGFLVEVAGGHTMPCERYIPQMNLTLGRYNLTHDFYVMDLLDTNVILGVQWLSTLGPITTNYKTMEMSFNSERRKEGDLEGNDKKFTQGSFNKAYGSNFQTWGHGLCNRVSSGHSKHPRKEPFLFMRHTKDN